jgi:hypothetical protein
VKLSPLQWAWVVATCVYLAVVFLDVANVLEVPNAVLILGGLLLALVSRVAGPSMAEVKRAHRRG